LRNLSRRPRGGGGRLFPGRRPVRGRFHGGSQRWRWRRTRSMTSSCSRAMAAMIFIGFWQEVQRVGSSSQTLEMSLAQERLRFPRYWESASAEAAGAGPGAWPDLDRPGSPVPGAPVARATRQGDLESAGLQPPPPGPGGALGAGPPRRLPTVAKPQLSVLSTVDFKDKARRAVTSPGVTRSTGSTAGGGSPGRGR
jgi:hypothetical protein